MMPPQRTTLNEDSCCDDNVFLAPQKSLNQRRQNCFNFPSNKRKVYVQERMPYLYTCAKVLTLAGCKKLEKCSGHSWHIFAGLVAK